MMLRGNLKQVRIEKNPARLRALESAAGEGDPAALALALPGEPPVPAAPAGEDRPADEGGSCTYFDIAGGYILVPQMIKSQCVQAVFFFLSEGKVTLRYGQRLLTY